MHLPIIVVFFLLCFSNISLLVDGFSTTRNTLRMGCDFFISKKLNIFYKNNGEHTSIELDKKKGYFFYPYFLDQNEENYQEKVMKYRSNQLRPDTPPIIIYEDDRFKRDYYKDKYTMIVEFYLNRENKEWKDVKRIVKFEDRCFQQDHSK